MSQSITDIRQKYFGNQTKSTESKNATLSPSAKYVVEKIRQDTTSVKSIKDCNEENLTSAIKDVEKKYGEGLTRHERDSVVAVLSSISNKFGILNQLINNSAVNDIIISKFNDISIQSGRVNTQTDLAFQDAETYKAFVENILKDVGKACTMSTPIVDVALDPTIRACVTHESFSPHGFGPMLTLRISRHKKVSLEGLVTSGLAPMELLEFLKVVICLRSSILIGGEVGTGKTTLLKGLADQIPDDESIVIIEDTHEIELPRKFVRSLIVREANSEGAGKITPAQAVRTGMRMAMNRIILGEMRDGMSAEAFIDVCSSGHSGLSTIHGRSAKDSLSRLELFLSRAQAGVGMDTIRRQISNAVSTVVFLDFDHKAGCRRVFEVCEVGSSSEGIVQLSSIFKYRNDGTWWSNMGMSRYNSALRDAGLQLNGVQLSCD